MKQLLSRHLQQDGQEAEPGQREREAKAAQRLSERAAKVREFLDKNDERIGTQGKAIKSNITDNESAKMPSSHGVIGDHQSDRLGYNGIATVDEKHQVVIDAQAFGDGHEAKHVEEVIESIDSTMRKVDKKLDILGQVVVTADSGFHSEEATKAVLTEYSGETCHPFRTKPATRAGMRSSHVAA